MNSKSARTMLAAVGVLTVGALTFPESAWAAKPRVPMGVYFGADTHYNFRGDKKQMILTRESQIGRKYDSDHHFMKFGTSWWTDPSNIVDWDLSRGRIPLLSWGCPAATSTSSGSAQINTGINDRHITRWAAAVRARRKALFVRYCWEMDAPFKAEQVGTPAEFIASWRRIWRIFNAVVNGVRANDYVGWAWVVTARMFTLRGGTQRVASFYPGDAYVDWIGADGYNWYGCMGSTWTTFRDRFTPWYGWAKLKGKPMMIPEFGTPEDPANPSRKPQWITSARESLKRYFPRVHAIWYFDTPGTKGCNWRLDTSPGSLDAWRRVGQDPYFRPSH